MYTFDRPRASCQGCGLSGADPFPPGRHPALTAPGLLRCGGHPARIPAGKGKSFRIADRPIIVPPDPRAQPIAMATMLMFPSIIFNHTFDALFKPEGSVLKTGKGPVIFAFPLDEKCATDEMIDLAADFVKSGGLQQFIANAPQEASQIFTGAMGGGLLGAKFGYWGAAIGAAVGVIKGIVSFFGGDQDYDVPDSLKSYSAKINGARTKKGLHYHYSTDDRDDPCAVLWFEQRGQYTIVEAARLLMQKLGQPWPGEASRPAPAPAAPPARPARAPQPLRPVAVRAGAPIPPAMRTVSRMPAPRRPNLLVPAAIVAGALVGAALLARRDD